MANRASRTPGAGFPRLVVSEAELEAAYRFLNNEAITPERMLRPHIVATMARAGAADTILAVHDTTHFNFGGAAPRTGVGSNNGKGQGFSAHVALAVLPGEERLPLGICSLERVNRTTLKKSRTKTNKQLREDQTKESLRWQRGVSNVEAELPVGTSCIHVMDREGDSYDLLSQMLQTNSRFVVRASYDRALSNCENRLFQHLSELPARAKRSIDISHRSHARRKEISQKRFPERQGRTARLSVSAGSVSIKHTKVATSNAEELTLNAVRVWEEEPPHGEQAVAWMLYTTEPISTKQQLLRVVDIYRSRWIVEEYFKALKTGCSFEKRQLESYEALSKALALFAPVAWRILLARSLSRLHPSAPATLAFARTELVVLQRHLALTGPLTTVGDALDATARLGGHLKRNGPPGWQTISRGMEALYLLTTGWRLARAKSAQM